MPLDPQNKAQILDRELRVWDLLLKGRESVEIARGEGVHPSVISRIKTRVEHRIIAETDGKVASLKARQLGEIRRARREAWRAWEESCKPAAKTTRRSGGTAPGTVEANEIKGQSGNPAFLEKVYDGVPTKNSIWQHPGWRPTAGCCFRFVTDKDAGRLAGAERDDPVAMRRGIGER